MKDHFRVDGLEKSLPGRVSKDSFFVEELPGRVSKDSFFVEDLPGRASKDKFRESPERL